MDLERKLNGNLREVWFDGREIPLERQDIWSLLNNSNIKKIVVTTAQRREGHYPLKTELITEINNEEDLVQVASGEIVISGEQRLLDLAQERGYRTCVSFSIQGRDALERSWQDASRYDYAVIDFDLPTNIPLELILARLQERRTILLKRETSFTGLEVAFGVMEKGSDGVLLATANPAEIIKASDYLSRQSKDHLELQPLLVKEVRHIGMGARACIDTTGLMTPDEGMIVGSTSNGGIFVCSETHYLPYMNLRPFRVNAGAVHSYIWMPNDAAEYLTDLSTGSKVLCVNTKGEARTLTVGRVKIEVRPLLLIKGEINNKEISVIVQDDWHIRLMDAVGKPQNATEIKPGHELLGYACAPGRHVGIKVEETIIEK
ncbi:MAG: putative alternative 3-dehydroquinate synthase [Peptococcaceae bacterium]|jgi:3-dehydroquinate synthase II/3-amino-4-hydroxybenzoic acid synthase|nr:putative alternative 3-dehydroquinate synthase [Peptococcaceae bacterium]